MPKNQWAPTGNRANSESQVEQHDLAFIQALHVMFVSVLAARQLRGQTFSCRAFTDAQRTPLSSASGPHAPPPPRRARFACTTLQYARGHGKGPSWLTYWPSYAHYSGRLTQTQCL